MSEENTEKKENKFFTKETIISGIVGILIGALLLFVIQLIFPFDKMDKALLTTKAGKVTGRSIYDEITKNGYPLSYLLDMANRQILNDKYKLTKEQQAEVDKEVDDIIKSYGTQIGYTEEEFLSSNGYESKDDFREMIEVQYKMKLYCKENLIKDEEIDEFYKANEIFGQVKTKHILVKTSDDVTADQALATANEIITKLNAGTAFDDVVKEYGDKIVSEEVNFDFFDEANYESTYIEASKALQKDEYTKTPVKTSYGYHVILCVDKQDKPSYDDVKDKIADLLVMSIQNDTIEKSLIDLREQYGLKFMDSKYTDEYKEYCDQYKD